VGSDGVFEKLTNFEIGKILTRHMGSKDAAKAAQEIVKFSKNAWLNVRT
jgi:serine/threonine protein phosphatase PrpC